MLNLIRRDVIMQKKQLIIFIPYILLFVVFGSPAILIFLIASIYIPLNAYAYDEAVESNILLNSLPYTRTEIIASRYLGAIVYMAASMGIASLALLAFNRSFTWTDIAIAAGLFLVFGACTFPLFQILKPGYISTVIIIGFVLVAVLIQRLADSLARYIEAISEFIHQFSLPTMYGGITLIVVGLYGISWLMTTTIYKRKAF